MNHKEYPGETENTCEQRAHNGSIEIFDVEHVKIRNAGLITIFHKNEFYRRTPEEIHRAISSQALNMVTSPLVEQVKGLIVELDKSKKAFDAASTEVAMLRADRETLQSTCRQLHKTVDWLRGKIIDARQLLRTIEAS